MHTNLCNNNGTIFYIYCFPLYSICLIILQLFIQILNSSFTSPQISFPLNLMFSSLKLKLQSILKNPFHRRSAKKIDSKREKSQTKLNNSLPQEIEITPKKIHKNKESKDCSSLLDQEHQYGPTLDDLDTVSKDTVPFQNNTTRLFENRATNQKWLDFVSDVDSSEKLLLPTSEELGQEVKKLSKKSVQMSKTKESIVQSQLLRSLTTQQNCNDQLNAQILRTPQKIQKPKIDSKCQQSKQKDENTSSNTLINWLEENKPEYFMIKLTKNENKRQDVATQLKKRNRKEYNKSRKQQANGSRYRTCCIICEEQINGKNPKQFITLACTHKLHKVCAQIIRWKPRMRCNVCEGKSLKDIVFSSRKPEYLRNSIGKSGRKAEKEAHLNLNQKKERKI